MARNLFATYKKQQKGCELVVEMKKLVNLFLQLTAKKKDGRKRSTPLRPSTKLRLVH